MVIMFMISSSTALSSIVTTVLTLGVVVDMEHRIRTDRIDNRKHAVWRARDWVVERAVEGVKRAWLKVKGAGKGGNGEITEQRASEERRGLLE